MQEPLTSHQRTVSATGHQNEHIEGMTNVSDNLTRYLQPAYTVRLRPEPDEQYLLEAPFPIRDPKPMTWHGITDQGMVRDHNEDNFSLLVIDDKALFVVADGMGGHDAGEVASRIAVDVVCREVRECLNRADPACLVERAIQKANSAVRREGMSRGSNMGTTLSVALVADCTAHIGNVGDSRAYWIENGSITQITEDHSLVARMAAAGKLTREEARHHPRSNVLYRSIGSDEVVKIDRFNTPLNEGGTLLLCTDGLWGDLSDEDIHRVCAEETDARAISNRLVQMAKENGGRDNITAVVVKIA